MTRSRPDQKEGPGGRQPPQSSAAQPGPGEDSGRASVSELAEEAGRDAATLVLRRAQLELSDQAPELRRTALAIASAGIAVVALLSAFVFGNWALASALASPLPGWRAPLVLAAAWLGVGLLVAVPLVRRWRSGDRTETLRARQQALEEAEQSLRQTLDRVGDAIALAAEDRIAAAILPLAGGMVEVGEGMVEATDEVLEAADEITDTVEDVVPGGIVVNRAVDIALAPGRLGVRVARRAFTLGRDDE
jgi:methyl-accepting chemotaxis protein